MKFSYKRILSLIGIIIFIYLIYKIGLDKIFESFSQINLWYVLLSLIPLSVLFFFLTYKWHAILKLQGFSNLGAWFLLKVYLIGAFYGFITPSRTGSLIGAVYLKEKTQRPLIECGTGIVVTHILDLLVIFLFATIGAVILTLKKDFLPGLLSKIIIAFIIFAVITLILISKTRSRFILMKIHKYLVPEKFKDKARDSFHSFYSSLPKAKNLLYPLFLTIIAWALSYTFAFSIAKSLNIHIPYFSFITIYAIATVIGMIPITISGLGTREASLITLFSVFNIPSASIMSMSILNLIIGACMPALIGFLLSIKK